MIINEELTMYLSYVLNHCTVKQGGEVKAVIK